MKKDGQNSTEYKPTAVERRLLEVLMNPETRLKTVVAICEAANCNRKSYYSAFNKPPFVALVKAESKKLIDKNIGPIITAFVSEAKAGSFQHGKVLLEMADMYTEKSKQELSADINHNIFNLPPEVEDLIK